jgi:hypothetical protein
MERVLVVKGMRAQLYWNPGFDRPWFRKRERWVNARDDS